MVADCKSAGLTPYVGSNPTPTMEAGQQDGGAAGQCDGLGAVRIAEQAAPLASRPAAVQERGCSSVGRASAFQAEGRGFESRRPLLKWRKRRKIEAEWRTGFPFRSGMRVGVWDSPRPPLPPETRSRSSVGRAHPW